ncbi:MAG TPA: DNA topoisomerase IB [Baekduia sp.]|jgi:DNA topoisomerase IB|nr:DNA topoisomerase IB [Baekduia sp.]
MAVVSSTKPRLRKVDCTGPGLRRVRRGRGFSILDPDGERVEEPEILARINQLVIPPAWDDVWICPYPGGHIQATGVDQKGRKQYLYHPRWRERRDMAKFEDMVVFARALPALRARVEADLARGGHERDHVLALAVRLLDRGFFRIGSEDYAVSNETYGLATMKKRHVRIDGDRLYFDYPAKHGKRRVQAVVDADVAGDVATLKRRRGGGDELLAYKERGRWVDVRSADINAWLKEATGEDVSAKDFRTWGATVLAALGLAVSPVPDSPTARRRAMARVVKEVAHYLGNTPAVARSSYIDPRTFDRYVDGITIAGALPDLAVEGDGTAIQGDVEAAVLELLTGEDSPALTPPGGEVAAEAA